MARVLPCLLVLAGALTGDLQAETIRVPADHATIQEAVDAAGSDDTVVISKGSYREQVVVSTAGLTLQGKGAVIDAEYAGPCLEVQGVDDVSVSGLTLVNGTRGILATGDGLSVVSVEVSNASGAAIEIEGDDATLSKNTLTCCNGDGIAVTATTPASVTTVEKNDLERLQGVGISVTGGRLVAEKNRIALTEAGIALASTATSGANSLIANTIEDTDREALAYAATGGARGLIRKNRLCRIDDDGIHVTAVGDELRVDKNTLEACGEHGILVGALEEPAPGLRITGNKISQTEDEGIQLAGADGPTIEGNRLTATEDTAIAVAGDGVAVRDNTIRDSGGRGIRLVGDDARVTDNAVSFSSLDGISVLGSDNVVEDNACMRNCGDGIEIDNDAGLTAADNQVLDNTCKANAHEGIDNSGLDTVIDDNKAKKNGGAFGPDIAGAGRDVDGVEGPDGTVASFEGNKIGSAKNEFDPGGATTPSRLDLDPDA